MVLLQQIEPWSILKEVEAGSMVWAGVLGLVGCTRVGSRVCVMLASGMIRIVEETEAVECTHHFCWFGEI